MCIIFGCKETTRLRRNLCTKHYSEAIRKGILDQYPTNLEKHTGNCKFEDCELKISAKGYCSAHYAQWKRGKELFPIGSRSTGGRRYNKKPQIITGYRYVESNGHANENSLGLIAEHRLVMSEHLGRPLYDTETVHHINGDRLDNRLENLELWNTSHLKGQRLEDKLEYAMEIMRLYAPDELKPEYR